MLSVIAISYKYPFQFVVKLHCQRIPKLFKFYDPKDPDSRQNTQQANQESSMRDNICTYTYPGEKMVYQKLFTCKTCKLSFGECICESCAKNLPYWS